MKFGAIDIGTNAARLLIGEVVKEDGRKFVNKVSYTRIPLRLGESVFDSGRINKKKAEQFIKTMRAFQLISELFEVKELRACATSAMRDAKNSEKIKTKILAETGIKIEVISGDEEANLIFGTFFLLDIEKSKPYIVVDVGGGSTEISIFKNGQKVNSKSFEIGTLRLLKGKTNDAVWQQMEDWVQTNLLERGEEFTFYATGGNINKAHKILGAINLEPIKFVQLDGLRKDLESISLKKRMEKYQLKPDRADVLVPALQIYCFLMHILGSQEVVVPKIGLSDGIVYDLYKKHKSTSKDA